MAADTNKKPVIETNETNPASVAGNGAQKSSRLPGIKVGIKIPSTPKGRALFFGLITLAVVIVVAVAVSLISNNTHLGQKVYAQAAGHKIYKGDVDKLIGTNKGVTEHQAATVLADEYLAQAMAKKEHISVTSQDIKKAYGFDPASLKTHNAYGYQSLVNQVYFSKLQTYNNGIYKGFLLVAQFSRYITFAPGLTVERQAVNPNFGNPKSIAADRKYAANFITGLYNKIRAGKMSWNKAAQTEMNDHTVGTNMYPSLSHSGPFDTSNTNLRRNDLLKPTSITKTIRSMKAGQTSKPFVVSVANPSDGSQTPAYYLVVRMDSVAGNQDGLSFSQALAQAKKEFGYKVNV